MFCATNPMARLRAAAALRPLALPEQRVRLTLEDEALPQNGNAPATHVNVRREEFQWLARESGPYAGQWVALAGNRLVAHGDELANVGAAAARAAGVDRPLLTHLPPVEELPGIVNCFSQ
jgi:hypothetical protein